MGLKAQDYKSTYPELARTSEFDPLNGTEMIFVWYFANLTSPHIDLPKDARVIEALASSGYKPGDKEKFLDLQFGEKLEYAINKMASFIPGARYFGWKATKNTYQNYLDILNKVPEDFVKTVGAGKDATTETDYNTYTTVTTRISSALPDLIARLEEGFGVSLSTSEEEEEESSMIRDWAQNRIKS